MSETKQLIGIFTTTFAIGIAGFCLATDANADAMYEAESTLSLTLLNVTDYSGNQVLYEWSNSWEVYYNRYYLDGDSFTDGDGVAISNYSPAETGNLSVGDTITSATSAKGSSGIGLAESYEYIGLELCIDSYFDAPLTFEFSITYDLLAKVGSTSYVDSDQAQSSSDVDILDDYLSVDVQDSVYSDIINGVYYGSLPVHYEGSFSLTLDGYGDENWISALLYSGGKVNSSTAPVPEPATLLLLSTGLAGLTATRFRSKRHRNTSQRGKK